MKYWEAVPPFELQPHVKAVWTLRLDGAAGEDVEHQAVPDGCVEIIRRLRGRSIWGSEQPDLFAAGMITAPACFRFSGDACFIGLRLWPWAWNALAKLPAPAFLNDWTPLASAVPGLDPPQDPDGLLAAARSWFDGAEAPRPGRAALLSQSVREMGERSGLSPRALQRWFAAAVGVPPRTYLRLLRFQQSMEELRLDQASLADHAARIGYADQAHMAREFRSISGVTASKLRRRTRGPFL
jgi:AraC-like DNA-binding protein